MHELIRRTGAVIFDLDGTLVDAFKDVVAAVNQARRGFGLKELPYEEVIRHVGRGPEVLIAGAIPELGTKRLSEGIKAFAKAYEELKDANSTLFEGVREFLAGVQDKRRAVLTNKLTSLAMAVLQRFDILEQFELVVGFDTSSYKKPDPRALVWVLGALRVTPDEAVYIGDSAVDAETARGAGVPFILVKTGLSEGVLGADVVVNRLDELL